MYFVSENVTNNGSEDVASVVSLVSRVCHTNIHHSFRNYDHLMLASENERCCSKWCANNDISLPTHAWQRRLVVSNVLLVHLHTTSDCLEFRYMRLLQ